MSQALPFGGQVAVASSIHGRHRILQANRFPLFSSFSAFEKRIEKKVKVKSPNDKLHQEHK